ncbi:Ca2+-transporting ATPase [Novosphingobium sp. CF614]|nr:Ca2+-transporting ATPase [Novosphingobium sp. CF614]
MEVLREPMLALLLAAGLIYLLLGDRTEALILLVFAGLSIAITIIQEARTERVLEALRDLSAPRALVVRDGELVRIPGREVVEGDILVLDAGDRIAADALLLEADGIEADESLLTGESVPVRKRAARHDEDDRAAPGGEDRPQVFAGSIVTHGRGLARVTGTGTRSRIGAIGLSLTALEIQAPRLQRETAWIVRLCAMGGIAVAMVVTLLYGLSRGGWLDAVLAGIAIGMSLLPEEFAVVLTIFLAMGAWRIAQVGVLTRRAAAIETLGAATVLCTDKTGTLTCNRMTVAELWLPSQETPRFADAPRDSRFRPLLETGALASAPVPSDPMEVAFHAAATDTGPPPQQGLQLLRTHGLRPDLLAMSNVWCAGGDENALTIAAKGAPEAIARLCRLDETQRAALDEAAQRMAARGMRVLGVASAVTDRDGLDKAHEEHVFVLLGLVGLTDPLRAGVAEAITRCRSAGIRVVMITGDYAATAKAIAEAAGLRADRIMTGEELAALSDVDFAARVGTIDVFARTMPEQKLRIVNALQAAGEVVAMTGDGVNDAPALKAAHIGIAMGRRGTDVAREASAIVLVEDDFGAIVDAVRLGRRIYDNIRKAVGFIFGVHVPIAALAIMPLVLGLPLVLGPIQIALLEMIIDPVCALVFEAEREESRLMRRPPRDPAQRLFSLDVIRRGAAQGALAAAVLIALYLAAARYGLPAAELRTLTFFALVSAILALVLANRSFSTSLGHALLRGNRVFRYVLGFIAAGSVTILTVPAIRRILGFAPLDWLELGLVVLTGAGLLVLLEFTKGRAVAG